MGTLSRTYATSQTHATRQLTRALCLRSGILLCPPFWPPPLPHTRDRIAATALPSGHKNLQVNTVSPVMPVPQTAQPVDPSTTHPGIIMFCPHARFTSTCIAASVSSVRPPTAKSPNLSGPLPSVYIASGQRLHLPARTTSTLHGEHGCGKVRVPVLKLCCGRG